jgi:hypothetical protein
VSPLQSPSFSKNGTNSTKFASFFLKLWAKFDHVTFLYKKWNPFNKICHILSQTLGPIRQCFIMSPSFLNFRTNSTKLLILLSQNLDPIRQCCHLPTQKWSQFNKIMSLTFLKDRYYNVWSPPLQKLARFNKVVSLTSSVA